MTLARSPDKKPDFSEYADNFASHGVVLVKGALDENDMVAIEAAFNARLAHVLDAEGALAPMYPTDEALVFNALGNSIDHPLFAKIIRETPVADIAHGVFGGRDTWYWEDQVWLKQGDRAARRTPWHQDTAYLPVTGAGLAVLWIPLETLAAANVLEVIRGSHRQKLYNAITFDPDDDTTPLYDEELMPRMPDIEADRSRWDIFSASMDRGDVLVFHPGCLHGGAPTSAGQRRRTLSFRFFDSDAVYQPLPTTKPGHIAENSQKLNEESNYAGFDKLKSGDAASLNPLHRQVRA